MSERFKFEARARCRRWAGSTACRQYGGVAKLSLSMALGEGSGRNEYVEEKKVNKMKRIQGKEEDQCMDDNGKGEKRLKRKRPKREWREEEGKSARQVRVVQGRTT